MRDVVIVCENPTLHSGFATVGRQVARFMHARGVRVRYVARYPGPAGAPAEPYEVLEADRDGDSSAEGGARLGRTLDAAHAAGPADHGVPLLSIGALWQHAELLAALGRRRPPGGGQVIVYLPVDAAPLPPVVGTTLERADVVVPYNAFGAQVLRRSGVTARIAPPIPHGVDTDVFAPLSDDERRAVRRERFGAGDDAFLVGFFGRNCGHKRPDLVLRIFAAWVNGGVARCAGCTVPVEQPLDPVGGAYGTLARCPHCGAAGPFERQAARPGARLYLHTELLTARERRVSGGWDLERIARRLGVADRVEFEPSLQFARGVAAPELARRMAACDVHLLPYEGGAWELTVLETGACGVPNVITDAAAPPEYAAPFSILVPPMMRVHGPGGARAFIDVGRAVAALQRLSRNREERRRLGQRGIEVARAHRWDRIGGRWLETMQPRRPWRRRARTKPAAFDEVADRLGSIQFTTPQNGRVLYDFVLDNTIEDILEIGFHHGVSTCYLAAALAQRGSGHIVTLDHRISRDKDPNLPQLLDEFGFSEHVTPVFAERSYTWELYRLLAETSAGRPSRQRFDFMFHDADHTWDNTSLAFLLGDVMLRPGGWMLFDDYTWTIQASESAMSQHRGTWPEEERRTPAVKEVFRLLIEPHPDYLEPIVTNNSNWAWVQKRDVTVRGYAPGATVAEGLSISRSSDAPSQWVGGNRWDLLRVPDVGHLEPRLSISVIIPARDQPLLKDVVDLVADQSYPDELVEIVVVDDRSERPLDVADLGVRARKRTRVVHHASPGFGAGAARSYGAALARHEVLAFLDSDIRVPHHYLESHARWHHVAENALVVGQMRMLDRPDVPSQQLRRDSAVEWKRVQWVADYLDRTDGLLIDHPDVWSVATGASVSVRRTFHDRFGGFAGFGIRGIEDIEFGYRAYAHGGLVVPEHQGYGWHPPERFFSDPARAKVAKRRRRELLADRVPTRSTRVEGSQRIRSVPNLVVNVRIPALEEVGTALLVAALDRWLVTTRPTTELILHGVARRPDHEVVADAVRADPRIRLVEQPREASFVAARVAFCELRNLRLAQNLVRRLDETRGLVGVSHPDLAPTVAVHGRALNRALLATGHRGDVWPQAAALRCIDDLFGSIWEDDPAGAPVGDDDASQTGSLREGVGSDADLLEQVAHLRAALHRVQAKNRRLRSRLAVLGLPGLRDEHGGGGR